MIFCFKIGSINLRANNIQNNPTFKWVGHGDLVSETLVLKDRRVWAIMKIIGLWNIATLDAVPHVAFASAVAS